MGFTPLLAAAAALMAQLPQATVAGLIVDAERGHPLSGAVVSLPDIDRAVATDSRGAYVLRDVPPGPQHLSVRYIGYAPRTVHAIVPTEGELRISIALTPLPVRLANVEVRSMVAVRGADALPAPSINDRAMTIGAVRNHPVLAEPDVLEAVGGGEISVSPEAPSGVHVRGGAADQTAYLIDGIPVLNPYHAGGLFAGLNPDAVAGLRVWSATPTPDYLPVLGGTVEAITRSPAEHFSGQGSASVTQTRLTLDGRLPGRAAYMLSARTGFPGLLARTSDASHIVGQSGDRLAKVDAPLANGRLRLLYFDSENELSTAATVSSLRNGFEWESRSLGMEWNREWRQVTMRFRAWWAATAGDAAWRPDSARVERLESTRSDAAAVVALEHRSTSTESAIGIRVERSRTSLAFRDALGGVGGRRASTSLPAITGRHRRSLGSSLSVQAAGAVTHLAGHAHASGELAVTATPDQRLTLSVALARRHQFVQSLRNDESVVAAVFPADLFIGHGAPGVPVATGRQVIMGLEYRPRTYARLALQGYQRRSAGLLLAAPGTGRPFAFEDFRTGEAASRGLSAEASIGAARYAAIVNYGWQRTRVRAGAVSYAPAYASSHRVDGGVTLFPVPTFSVRLGATAIAGRRSTPLRGPLEWESCNLLDFGCEFGGSPPADSSSLGAARLPTYLRIDIGVRKHWHLRVAGRDAPIAIFGTITNVLGRANVLAYAFDPLAGSREPVEMRPMAPLVVGVDWGF